VWHAAALLLPAVGIRKEKGTSIHVGTKNFSNFSKF
jgi:hypothetical protein